MQKQLILILGIVVITIILTSCSQYIVGQKFDDISIFMSKETIKEKLKT